MVVAAVAVAVAVAKVVLSVMMVQETADLAAEAAARAELVVPAAVAADHLMVYIWLLMGLAVILFSAEL